MVKGFGRRARRPLECAGVRTPAPWRTVVQGEGYGEGFRTPAPWRTVVRGLGPAFETLPRRKPRAGRGAAWSGASYGDLRIADGSGVSARGPVARNLGGGNDDDDRVRSRGRRPPAPARGRKRARSGLRGGMRGDGHEVSILIRLGGGERAGRGPSNVSTTIIRPPQHGHRRGDEPSSPSLSASAFAFWGETLGAASAWRTRSMLRARTVPANRP